MDSFFGIPLQSIMVALLALVGASFALLAWIGWRNPLLIRMGLRNAVRRKTQTVLIVIGLMLSTLIISAAFATGDTVGHSITETVYNSFVEADVVVGFDGDSAEPGVEHLTDADLATLRAALEGAPEVQALTGLVQEQVPALNVATRLSEPRATLVGVDPATVDDFNSLLTLDGRPLSAAALGAGEAYVTRLLAEDLAVAAGGEVTIFYDNEPHLFRVAAIVRDNAMSGGSVGDGAPPAGGIVAPIGDVRAITGEPERIDLIVASAPGGVRNAFEDINALQDRVEAAIESAALPATVQITKAEAVGFAELLGSFIVTFFVMFGLFSIAAGIMLIFLTFVMLAAERRSEMGMARAVGMKRLHLTQSFIAEGMTYNIGAAFVGALLGLGVSFLLITVMGRITADFGLSIAFHVNPQGFVVAYSLGVVITFATVAFSSWRAANLNIVRAIRDLPEPQPLRGRDTTVRGLLLAAVGVGWYVVWLLVLALGGLVVFGAFILGLSTYGLGNFAGGAVIGFFIWGAVLARRRRTRLLERIAHIAWWVVFSLLALVAWALLRTRGWANHHRNAGGWALWMLILGALGTWWGGWIAGQAFAYTGGTTLVLLAAAMLAVYFGASARRAFTISSLALLWFWLLPLPFSLFLDVTMEDQRSLFVDPLNWLASLVGLAHPTITGNIEMFFVSGLCITAASTLFVVFNADLLLRSLNLLSRVLGGTTPAIRTAIAYPLAAKFRTGMTLAMFGLVVFSLVVMATLNSNFTQLFTGEAAKGGFEVAVAGNPNNRIDDLRATLAAVGYDVDGTIEGVGTLRGAAARMRTAEAPAERLAPYRLQGLDDEFARLAQFSLSTRAAGYADDRAVFEALRTDPTVAIVDETRLGTQQQQGGPPGQGERFSISRSVSELVATPWQPIPIVVRNPATGAEVTLNVIGVIEGRVTGIQPEWSAVFVNAAVLVDHFEGGEIDRFYVIPTVRGDAAAIEVAQGIESALLERGVQATSIGETINRAASQSTAFQALFEGFMGLGLIVGIAALGVIAFRTVAERRQQIGMLRAIGYSRRLVALSFFLESSFIAVTGIVTGLVLGSALSYNLLTSPDFTNGAELEFAIPWVRLAIIVGIAYGASALMTLIPARSASRVPVAEALRYSG